MKKILVTGGAGFIGSHLVDKLVRHNFDVNVIDNLSSTGDYRNLRDNIGNIRFIGGDLRHIEICREETKDVDIIFHLAAKARVQPSIKDPLLYFNNNVRSTVNLLKAAVDNKVERVVIASSSSVYGDQASHKLNENMIPNPLSPYGLSKLECEYWAILFNKLYGLETVILRPFSVYGSRQTTLADGAYALVIGIFLGKKELDQALPIVGDGNQTRDFTYIDDVVEAFYQAGFSDEVGNGEIINVGRGNNRSINKVAEIIGGKDYPTAKLPARIEAKHTLADNRKLKRLLGVSPKIDIEQGIPKCLNSK